MARKADVQMHEVASKQQLYATVEIREVGKTASGESVRTFRLGDPDGPSVTVSEYGCSLVSIKMPDRNGALEEIILGYPSLEDYIADQDYIGATVGRFANRISGAKFELDGSTIHLPANQGAHHLHGGVNGFNKHLWRGSVVRIDGIPTIKMERISPDGEEGYPGNLNVSALFTFKESRELEVHFEAATDQKTIVNLTIHPYFNLTGSVERVENHILAINSNSFLPIDSDGVPTGEIRPVEGTSFDFRTQHEIGRNISDDDEQLKFAGGYDHCWVLDTSDGGMNTAARILDPASGRTLELQTDSPGLQLYTGNFLGCSEVPDGFPRHGVRTGFCLEPQAWPDSPNKPHFPDVVLNPGLPFRLRIRYIFGVDEE